MRQSDHRREENMLQDLCSAQASSHHPPQVTPWPHTEEPPKNGAPQSPPVLVLFMSSTCLTFITVIAKRRDEMLIY